MGLTTAILTGLFIGLAVAELQAWAPRLAKRSLYIAVKVLPLDKRERYYEEWSGDIESIPGNISKVLFSLDLIRGAIAIRLRSDDETQDGIKRAFDIVVASILLMLVGPLMFAIAAKLKLVDRGPVFLAYTRVGRHGEPFRCFKFRTTVPNAKEVLEQLLASDPAARAEWERNFRLRNDPRITPLGRFLRKTSLDELPLLINVIRGEMSLVGPRPVIPGELDLYGEAKKYYLKLRPGITDPRHSQDSSAADNITWYARDWNLRRDIIILIKTCFPGLFF